MNTIPAQEIKRRGISALDDLLKDGPVHVIKNNRPSYVVMSEDDYARLIERKGLWDLLEQPVRRSRSKEDIGAANGGAGASRGDPVPWCLHRNLLHRSV